MSIAWAPFGVLSGFAFRPNHFLMNDYVLHYSYVIVDEPAHLKCYKKDNN